MKRHFEVIHEVWDMQEPARDSVKWLPDELRNLIEDRHKPDRFELDSNEDIAA
jgi:hypothetical protein